MKRCARAWISRRNNPGGGGSGVVMAFSQSAVKGSPASYFNSQHQLVPFPSWTSPPLATFQSSYLSTDAEFDPVLPRRPISHVLVAVRQSKRPCCQDDPQHARQDRHDGGFRMGTEEPPACQHPVGRCAPCSDITWQRRGPRRYIARARSGWGSSSGGRGRWRSVGRAQVPQLVAFSGDRFRCWDHQSGVMVLADSLNRALGQVRRVSVKS